MGFSGGQTQRDAGRAGDRPARKPDRAVSYTLRETYGTQDLEGLLARVVAAEANRAAAGRGIEFFARGSAEDEG